MALVAGIDSSTQSCKVVICDAETGETVRSGAAPHPGGTEVDPSAWWTALGDAAEAAGGLDDVAAVSVGAQQHGMICLDAAGNVVRDALLWNDTRSSDAADALIEELGGPAEWADRIGVVPGRLDHRDEVALAGRQRAQERRRHRGGVPSARLADVAPVRLDRRRRHPHRPQRRQRHRLLRRRGRQLPDRPARARDARTTPVVAARRADRTRPPGGRRPGRCSARVPVTTPPRHSASESARGTASSRWAPPAW